MVQTLPLSKDKPDCPERRMYWYGEMGFCELNGKHCLLDAGYSCAYYNDYIEENKHESA